MKKAGNIIFLVFLALAISCRTYVEHPDNRFLDLLKNPRISSQGKLNFEGVYHHLKRTSFQVGMDYVEGKPTRYIDTAYLDYPIFFFENGLMAYSGGLYPDSSIFNESMRLYGTQKDAYLNDWGIYEMKQDTLKATLYCVFSKGGYGSQRLLCHFEGIVHNRDTIYQWEAVPPYPSHLVGDALDELERLKNPRDLYFKSVPIRQLIDPEKAWINEFKNEGISTQKKEK